MTKDKPECVLLIDDDPGNNMISKMFLKKILPDADVLAFTDPQAGVAYILDNYTKEPVPTILLLDINMPVLNGWEVLEILSEHADMIKQYITIHILSSSIDSFDKQKANSQPLVTSFIEKPLKVETLRNILLGQ
ncbi:MAG: response regulator [Flavipsychrobacter sp.]|nr:response regulator [Flavipsychrobacter sp.]